MSCTTILVGKNASNDHSTMIARTDDGFFDVKKMVVVQPEDQPRVYKSVIGHLTIELPDHPMKYTSCPNVDLKRGIWAATGINEANVGMSATETITTNPRVLGADPHVRYQKAENGEEEKPGGIGEEDIVVLVLPYIHSAREGVLRLGALLEKYGTYENNGIAFNDENEVWWLETIGGHHWIATKVEDDEVVIMPNRFGLDHFDFDDAFGAQKANLCSADLREFIEDNCLDLNVNGKFNPRNCFGSNSDMDRYYNTPRQWYMGRYFNPTKYKWDGPDADYNPESYDIPWAVKPEFKVTVEDVKRILSSYYQGTPYNTYSSHKERNYRPIGISRTGVMAICQIRSNQPKELKGVEWVCFGSLPWNTVVPVYTQVNTLPAYYTDVTTDVSTDNFYWQSRLIGAMADPHYGSCVAFVERYQNAVVGKARAIMNEMEKKMKENGDYSLLEEVNQKIADMCKKETTDVINKIMYDASLHMKNTYNRGDD